MNNISNKCAASVTYGSWGRRRQCKMNATHEGFCFTHSPAGAAKREAEKAEKDVARAAQYRRERERQEKIARAVAKHDQLVLFVRNVTMFIDVSTINNNKRCTKTWGDIKEIGDALLKGEGK